MTNSEPQWLTIAQAAAWVQYRTREAIEQAKTANGYSALRYAFGPTKNGKTVWGAGIPVVASIKQLQDALLSGELKAIGSKNGIDYSDIPAFEWRRLAIAPGDARRQHPYKEILISTRSLKGRWPQQGVAGSSTYQKEQARALYEDIMREDPGMTQTRAARELRARYEKQIARPAPSQSGCTHWIREWRGGSAP